MTASMDESNAISGDTPALSAETPDNTAAGEQDFYPPDADDVDDIGAWGAQAPQPLAQHVRKAAKGLKTGPGKAKARKRVARGSSRIHVQEKRRKALELRKAGATYHAIAEAVGYSDAAGARKAVIKSFGEVIQEPVNELRTIQIERLNHMLMVLWGKVQAGDVSAINTSLGIMNKIDALMGTEAARQVEVRNDTAILVVDGSKDDYIAALKKMSGAGINADGTNMGAPKAISGPVANPQAPSSNYPPGMGMPAPTAEEMTAEDIVDAVLVDDIEEDMTISAGANDHSSVKMSECLGELGTVCMEPGCPVHHPMTAQPVVTKSKFKFGVDPTVKREKGDGR